MIRSNTLKRILGGRPMNRIGHAFVDQVSGKDVHYFRDGYGRVWMANNRWSWFRVRAKAVD